MEIKKRTKNEIDFEKIDKNLFSERTTLVLDWFLRASSSVQNIVLYDWSDDFGLINNINNTKKAQSLADWIEKNRPEFKNRNGVRSMVLYNLTSVFICCTLSP